VGTKRAVTGKIKVKFSEMHLRTIYNDIVQVIDFFSFAAHTRGGIISDGHLERYDH